MSDMIGNTQTLEGLASREAIASVMARTLGGQRPDNAMVPELVKFLSIMSENYVRALEGDQLALKRYLRAAEIIVDDYDLLSWQSGGWEMNVNICKRMNCTIRHITR